MNLNFFTLFVDNMTLNITSDSGTTCIVNTVLGYIEHGLNVGPETTPLIPHITFSLKPIKCARYGSGLV